MPNRNLKVVSALGVNSRPAPAETSAVLGLTEPKALLVFGLLRFLLPEISEYREQ